MKNLVFTLNQIDFIAATVNDNWDGDIEVIPVYDNGDFVEPCEPENADYWGVYLHQKTGGVQCVADLPNKELAEAFAAVIKAIYLLKP